MGVDCVFVAHNVRGVTPEDLEGDLQKEVFPTSGWSSRICAERCKVIDELIFWHDDSRYYHDEDYQKRVIEYLKKKCGGQAGVFGDVTFSDEDVVNWIRRNPEEAWSSLQKLQAED